MVGGRIGICISIVKTFGDKSNGTHSGGGVRGFFFVRWYFRMKTMIRMITKKIKTMMPKIHSRLWNVSWLLFCTSFGLRVIWMVELEVVRFSFFRLKPQETSFTRQSPANGELLYTRPWNGSQSRDSLPSPRTNISGNWDSLNTAAV